MKDKYLIRWPECCHRQVKYNTIPSLYFTKTSAIAIDLHGHYIYIAVDRCSMHCVIITILRGKFAVTPGKLVSHLSFTSKYTVVQDGKRIYLLSRAVSGGRSNPSIRIYANYIYANICEKVGISVLAIPKHSAYSACSIFIYI